MTDFEFLFALFGILFGLVVAEVSLRFVDALEAKSVRPLGVLTPALAFLILTDLTNFSVWLWASRGALAVSLRLVFLGMLLAMIYLIAATQAFPRREVKYGHLDEHYWSRKRIVAGGLLLVNFVVTGALLSRAMPLWDDWWFYFYFPSYIVALAGLTFSRSPRLDLFFLGWALLVNLSSVSDLVPHSDFGRTMGIVSNRE